jgi:hypothetical protein
LDGACPARTPGPDPGATPAADDDRLAAPGARRVDRSDECTKHADCSRVPGGRCVRREPRSESLRGEQLYFLAHNECVYDECVRDEDCRRDSPYEPRAERACNCDIADINRCTFGNCRKDTDCPPPFPCGPYRYCHSDRDGCRKKSDCNGAEECMYSWEVKHYVCKEVVLPPPGG